MLRAVVTMSTKKTKRAITMSFYRTAKAFKTFTGLLFIKKKKFIKHYLQSFFLFCFQMEDVEKAQRKYPVNGKTIPRSLQAPEDGKVFAEHDRTGFGTGQKQTGPRN